MTNESPELVRLVQDLKVVVQNAQMRTPDLVVSKA
jgi:hypothetical protein